MRVDKNKAVVCCLLATSVIMLSEKKKRKRKMCSKKWYLKRNLSYDAHLLNELLETEVPWDDAIVVSAGRLRKLWDSRSELRSSLCERRLERTFLKPALLPVKTAQFTQFSRQVWCYILVVKSFSLTESVIGRLCECVFWVWSSTGWPTGIGRFLNEQYSCVFLRNSYFITQNSIELHAIWNAY